MLARPHSATTRSCLARSRLRRLAAKALAGRAARESGRQPPQPAQHPTDAEGTLACGAHATESRQAVETIPAWRPASRMTLPSQPQLEAHVERCVQFLIHPLHSVDWCSLSTRVTASFASSSKQCCTHGCLQLFQLLSFDDWHLVACHRSTPLVSAASWLTPLSSLDLGLSVTLSRQPSGCVRATASIVASPFTPPNSRPLACWGGRFSC